MNRRGFTLVELLSVVVVLAIIVGVTIPAVTGIIENTKKNSEKVFVNTLKNVMETYIASSAKKLTYKSCPDNPSYSYAVVTEDGEDRDVIFQDVIDSPYKPIRKATLYNPGNEISCAGNVEKVPDSLNGGEKEIVATPVYIYRNNNYVYYYKINKADFWNNSIEKKSCFDNINTDDLNNKINYVSNIEEPGNFIC